MENDFIIRPIVNCLPAWFRFAQCLRRYRDSKEIFPHLVNAGKYSTTFLVVIFATLRNVYKRKSWLRIPITAKKPKCKTSTYFHLKFSEDYENTFDNPFTILWILSSVISSCYAYTWDIKMDWGLFDKNANENKFLREEIVYSSTVSILWHFVQLMRLIFFHQQFFYYFAIIEDFILRFIWALAFFLTEFKYVSGDIMTSIVAPLEVFR